MNAINKYSRLVSYLKSHISYLTKMKSITSIVYIFCLAVVILSTQSCGDEKHHAESHDSGKKYTCPMHPQVVQNAPGTCPVCAMDLVPVSASGNKGELILSESQIQLANIKTMVLNAENFNTSTVLNARIVSNPEFTDVISSRYAGRVEKLFVKETGISVAKGQALFQIYSEELQTLQQDYLLQVKQAAAFPEEKIYATLKEAAKNKLRLLGFSNSQIEALAKANKTSPLITVSATASGIVNEVNISEGQYVAEGTPVLRLENLSQLWLEADVYPSEAASIKLGTLVQVSVNGFPELAQSVKINFIAPQIDPGTQVLKVRGQIQSRRKLQPGMQATALLPKAQITKANALPLDAVIRDERGAHVWVKTGAHSFKPKMVETGEEDANQIIISDGLDDESEVVVSGAYLLWSEFVLKKGTDAMKSI